MPWYAGQVDLVLKFVRLEHVVQKELRLTFIIFLISGVLSPNFEFITYTLKCKVLAPTLCAQSASLSSETYREGDNGE